MSTGYSSLIHETYTFPVNGFKTVGSDLHFYDIDLIELINRFGTPLRITYLPKVREQIKTANFWFNKAIERLGYKGKYVYCYCTKSSHFQHIMETVITAGSQLEISSAYDIDLIERLHQSGILSKEATIVCNGFKTDRYIERILKLIKNGHTHVITVMDDPDEIERYNLDGIGELNIGIRLASEEEPNFEFYTSRLGIPHLDIIDLYKQKIRDRPAVRLKMLHFFINKGISDTPYYWSELDRALSVFTQLKKLAPSLEIFNIGGGLPIRNSLHFDYGYAHIIEKILSKIQSACKLAKIREPDIYSEFGKYTVGESGALIFKVLKEKIQNDRERWYMIDGSLMTTLPDTWGIGERFLLLPVNKWNEPYQRVNIGGLSCDQYDYYDSEVHLNEIYLPNLNNNSPLYLGFFNIGAYQEALSGYGGTKHCLIPSPQHVLLDLDEQGKLQHTVFRKEQEPENMLELLGYK